MQSTYNSDGLQTLLGISYYYPGFIYFCSAGDQSQGLVPAMWALCLYATPPAPKVIFEFLVHFGKQSEKWLCVKIFLYCTTAGFNHFQQAGQLQ
jgi:hypothetical protein